MRPQSATLAGLAMALVLASGAAAGPAAPGQRLAIAATIQPSAKAVLTPLGGQLLERDAGRFDGVFSRTPDRTLLREGQTVYIHSGTWTFTGKQGTLVFRERNEWVDAGATPDLPPWIATGTWKVVRGTGRYAGMTGGGRSAHAGLGRRWVARYEGVLTVP